MEHSPILQRPDYQGLFKYLNTKEDKDLPPIERSAKYILSQELLVPRLALDNEQNYFLESLRGIRRRCLDKNLPTDIKVEIVVHIIKNCEAIESLFDLTF